MFNFFLLFYTQNNPLSFTLLSTRRTTYIVYIPHLLYTLCPSLQSLAISSTCVSFHYFRFGTADVSCKLLLLKKTYFKTESSFLQAFSSLLILPWPPRKLIAGQTRSCVLWKIGIHQKTEADVSSPQTHILTLYKNHFNINLPRLPSFPERFLSSKFSTKILCTRRIPLMHAQVLVFNYFLLRLLKKSISFFSKTIPVCDIKETEISRQTLGKTNYKENMLR